MTIELIVIGKTDSEAVSSLTEQYLKRINHYIKFSVTTLPDIRNTKKISENSQKRQEGEMLLKNISEGDYVVLLDEKGEQYRSVEFAAWLQKRLNSSVKKLTFIIGGPYGFSENVYKRADSAISLSKMTFSHQLVRTIFCEQLYRGFTILKNEPYHHE